MHLRPRAIAPGIPLVSISVSFVALRLLSLAEPKVLPGKSGDASAFAGPSLRDQRQHSYSRGLGLFPWAHAVPLDIPMAQRAPPSVVDDLYKRDADLASSTSASLWRDCQLEAMRSLHHPWTLGLATGATSRRSFQHYVAQDAYFLRAFAKAYAYALTKVEDEGDVRAFHSLIGSVLDELGLHASYAAKWGLDIHNIPPPLKATSEYVNFLLGVASDPASSVAQVLASMAPCMRLYAFLGKELEHAFPLWGESVYAEWIETYSSEEFETAAVLVETLLDAHSAEAEYPSLLILYRKAMELEYAFFAAQTQGTAEDDRPHRIPRPDDSMASVRISSGGSATFQEGEKRDEGREVFHGVQHRVALLCVDFDDTLTDGDTTSLLVKTAKGQRGTADGQAEVDREWKVLTSLFLNNWSEVTEDSLKAKLAEEDRSGGVDRKGLEAMLLKLQTVDLDSVSRVSDSKVLKGITRENVHEALTGPLRPSWKVRPGMTRCLSQALASSFRTHVVSINWSRDLITGVLSDTLAGNDESSPAKLAARVDGGAGFSAASNSLLGEMKLPGFGGDWPAPVTSNDLKYDEHGVSTGDIAVKVSGSFGKHQHFLNLATTARETAGGFEAVPRTMSVYVGDSVTDLLAMLDADVGIVVGNSDGGAFERVASAFGIAIRPLAAAYRALGEEGGNAGNEAQGEAGEPLEAGSTGRGSCVYRASGWAEIDVFLFGDGHH